VIKEFEVSAEHIAHKGAELMAFKMKRAEAKREEREHLFYGGMR
jgi:hypothetical protein